MAYKLEVRKICKIFGDNPKTALKLLAQNIDKDEIFERTGQTVGVYNASLGINEGEIFVVMGLSGSGKSTLVRLLNRLIEPTQGQVLIDGEDITVMKEEQLRQMRRNKISMVFQSFALMPHLNVLDNTAFGLALAGEPLQQRQEKARAALSQVGLETNINCYPDELSGGMQQRVGLARALANNPDIMLMDEAFSALDPLIRAEMQDELVRMQSIYQRTIVFISHDLDEAMRIGDRIAIMQGGVVVQVGTPDEILKKPANDYVRSFFKGVDVSHVFSAGDIAHLTEVTLIRKGSSEGLRSGLQQLKDNDRDFGYVIDKDNNFIGVVSADSLYRVIHQNEKLDQAMLSRITPVTKDTPIHEIIGIVAKASCAVPVITDQQKYLGCISKTLLLETLDREA